MLSLIVIGAAQVLSILETKCPFNFTDRDKCTSLSFKELKNGCTVEEHYFRIALDHLLRADYIGENDSYPARYFLLVSLEDISLYDLIKVCDARHTSKEHTDFNIMHSGLADEWNPFIFTDEQLALKRNFQLKQIKLSHLKQIQKHEENVPAIVNALNPFFIFCMRGSENEFGG